MKTFMLSITVAVAAFAQANANPPTPIEVHREVVAALQAVHDQFPEPLKKFTETFPLIAVPRERMIMLAQAGAPGTAGAEPIVDPAAIADWANNLAAATTRATLDGIFPRSAPRKPVIVGGSGNARANAAMEEDLNVMMRILEKAAGGKDESRPTAGGIELFSFGKSTSPRVFYIDGYGAMFVLNVRYPLLAPPTKDDSRTNEPTNSEWEKAREEVYGRGRSADDVRFNIAPGDEFDAQKVESLKGQLIEDMLNAKNIRNLKADDHVTVVVLGGGQRGGVARRESRTPAGGRGGGGGGVGGRAGAGGGGGNAFAHVEVQEWKTSSSDSGAQSTMTLRVKKSDVDKFAKEKQAYEDGKSSKQLSEITDEFAKKVSVQAH